MHKLVMRARAFIILVMPFLTIAGGLLVSDPKPVSAVTCTVTISATLVNSCRPWLAVAAGKYPEYPSDTKSQVTWHETRIGKHVDAIKTYHTPGQKLDSTDVYYATRANTYLMANWKPALPWSTGTGGNATVNAQIDAMADSIKAVAPHKVFLTVNHEPENDVVPGSSPCAVAKGSSGTPADFIAMWRNVHSRFKARGVTNVVWTLAYINYPPFDCMINSLYPGDDVVDWIMFNAYGGHDGHTFAQNVQHFYSLLSDPKNVATNRNYMSKPWGIAEWSARNTTTTEGINYFNQAQTVVETNQFPKLKLYMVFDDIGPDGNENRVGYTSGTLDNAKMAAYKSFAQSPAFSATTPPPPTDTSPPAVSITAPANGSTLNKTVGVTASASDNVGVTDVKFSIDGNVVADDTNGSDGWSFNWDTTAAGNGAHTVTATAYDAATNNTSANISVTITNSGPTIASFIATPTDINNGQTSNLAWSVSNSDGCSINPGGLNNTTGMTWTTGALNTTTTFTLSCHNVSGVATKTVTVNVLGVASIASFTANPATVIVSRTTTLNWTVYNTTACSVTPNGPSNTQATSWQTLGFTSTGTTTYTLTCQNSLGAKVKATVDVIVQPAPTAPSNVVLSANTTSITSGGSVILNWTSVDATSCTISPGNATASGSSSSVVITNITSTTTYHASCSNSVGSTSSNNVTVNVNTTAKPVVLAPSITSFTANPTSIDLNGTSTLTWNTTNAVGCNLNPSPLSSTSGNNQWTTGPLTASTAYTLTCKNSDNATVSANLSVIVANKPITTPAPKPVTGEQINPGQNDSYTSAIVIAPNGTRVVNVPVTGTATQGDLITLNPSIVVDEDVINTIAKVEYYDGATLIQTVYATPFALDTSLLNPGEHTLTQRIYYVDGSVSNMSQLVSITAVKKPITAPPSNNNFVWTIVIGIPILGGAVFGVWLLKKRFPSLFAPLASLFQKSTRGTASWMPNPREDPDLRGISLPKPTPPKDDRK